MYTYTFTHMHCTLAHTCTRTHICTHKHTYVRTHILARTHMCCTVLIPSVLAQSQGDLFRIQVRLCHSSVQNSTSCWSQPLQPHSGPSTLWLLFFLEGSSCSGRAHGLVSHHSSLCPMLQDSSSLLPSSPRAAACCGSMSVAPRIPVELEPHATVQRWGLWKVMRP